MAVFKTSRELEELDVANGDLQAVAEGSERRGGLSLRHVTQAEVAIYLRAYNLKQSNADHKG